MLVYQKRIRYLGEVTQATCSATKSVFLLLLCAGREEKGSGKGGCGAIRNDRNEKKQLSEVEAGSLWGLITYSGCCLLGGLRARGL